MLRTGLLVSTAMTAVTLLLTGAPAQAQTNMHVVSRDPNTRFLCTYGEFDVSWSRYGQSGEGFTTWTHVAVPTMGHGKLLQRIVVEEGRASQSPDGRFSAGIYSNTASGLPGTLIAGGSASVASSCTKIQIPISPTTLANGKTYWIVEQAYQHGHTWFKPRELYWALDPATKRKAYVQQHSSSPSGYRYTAPWAKQKAGPYVRLR